MTTTFSHGTQHISHHQPGLTSLLLSLGLVTCATTSTFMSGHFGSSSCVNKTQDLKQRKSPTSTCNPNQYSSSTWNILILSFELIKYVLIFNSSLHWLLAFILLTLDFNQVWPGSTYHLTWSVTFKDLRIY